MIDTGILARILAIEFWLTFLWYGSNINYGEEGIGLYCFLGIDLHPELRKLCLSCDIDEWDIYASCYVTDTNVLIDKCKLP